MPFDSSIPADHSPLVSAEIRGQFNALKTLFDSGAGLTSAVVDSVSTVGPGEPATVTLSVTGTVLHISFALPRGADGLQGVPGLQGPMGEVSPATLTSAISDTARNPGGIAPFGGTFSDPPTQAEMQAFAAWSESLRAALAR